MQQPTPLTPARRLPTPTPRRRLEGLLGRAVPLLLRGSLGIIFTWFGALKLAGAPTLPAALIAAITPFIDPDLSVPLVGAVEVALGVGLLVGRWLPVVLAGVALQLSGTLLVLLLRPDVAFVDGNPLLPSVEGEYVVKNLVLLAATAALALHTLSPDRMRPPPTGSQTPTIQTTEPQRSGSVEWSNDVHRCPPLECRDRT
jgi:putative oxidoreductase